MQSNYTEKVTRQEFCQLAVQTYIVKTKNIIDENYFAGWAKNAIYSVAAIKSGDTYVMTGTGNGKFSPEMNYTREQAIATMWRLFICNKLINYYF